MKLLPISIGIIIGLMALMIGAGLGCKSTPQAAAFQTAGITDVAVTSALAGYDLAAKDGRTTVAQNQQVAAAFAKYQQAMAVALDAGAIYAASSQTNANDTAAAQALSQATLTATASLTDVLNLISTFTSTNK